MCLSAPSSNSVDHCSNPTVAFVQDVFSFRESYDPPAFDIVFQVDPVVKENMMSYQRLLDETMTPFYEGSKVIALCSMLRALQLKQGCNMTDTAFNKWAAEINYLLPEGNKYPNSYATAKKKLEEDRHGL